MRTSLILCALVLVLCVPGCTPKTTEPVATPTQTAPAVVEKPVAPTGPCRKFSDARNPDEALRNFVLYRDFLKAEEWQQAFEYWQKVYAEAPAADGQRNSVFADGIRFFEHFIEQSKDSTEKERFVDRIFQLYDEIDRCYPEGGYVPARKGFDLYYSYPNRATYKQIYDLFKLAIDRDGLETADFVINPFSSLLVDLYFAKEITKEEAQQYQGLIRKIIAKGLETCEGTACERWRVVDGYAPARLEAFEVVRGFYDCDYYMAKYMPVFEESPNDCDVLREVYSRLKFGGCPDTDERLKKIIEAGNANCNVEKGPVETAYNCLRDGDYECAISGFEKAAEEASDPAKKGQYLLLISKIYYGSLKNFPQARKYALRAASARPNWGEPYILIGRLYASSGPLCGPGRGWDSQIVVWPAIDMWSRAKSVDPSCAAEVNKMIGRYAQYMPSKEDIFQRNLKSGDRFYVGCWIQEYTTIRSAD